MYLLQQATPYKGEMLEITWKNPKKAENGEKRRPKPRMWAKRRLSEKGKGKGKGKHKFLIDKVKNFSSAKSRIDRKGQIFL